jgi:hypothetical protein
MRKLLLGILSAVFGLVLLGLLVWLLIVPQVDWDAAQQPGAIERARSQDNRELGCA